MSQPLNSHTSGSGVKVAHTATAKRLAKWNYDKKEENTTKERRVNKVRK